MINNFTSCFLAISLILLFLFSGRVGSGLSELVKHKVTTVSVHDDCTAHPIDQGNEDNGEQGGTQDDDESYPQITSADAGPGREMKLLRAIRVSTHYLPRRNLDSPPPELG